MGQFKPMVKMMTTEPTVELKLKKGGAVAMKKGGSAKKEVKKADGGTLGALAGTPALVGRPAVAAPVRTPIRPSMAARRKAMAVGRPVMKEGGESKAEHAKEMKTAEDLKKHKSMPASKAHAGLKTGGVAMGQGGYKDGGKAKKMAMGGLPGRTMPATSNAGGAQRGLERAAAMSGRTMPTTGRPTVMKSGGKTKKYAKGGIVTEAEGSRDAGAYRNTMMHSSKPDHSPAKTGDVKLGNGGGYKTGGVAKAQGGYKKGGATKKFAKGGSVNDSGKAESMPQGRKKPSTPVSINQLSGTFKKGGQVMTPAESRLQNIHEGENAPAMKAAKADSNEVYSKFGKKKGGKC